jgi:uncharacterized protein YaaQ
MNDLLVKHDDITDINVATLGLLMRMGNARFEQGELRQALDVYLKIIEEHPGSEESKIAKAKSLSIAKRYEQEGTLRLSLDVLERLEQAI